LRELGAIAEESSFLFSTELLGWRSFANRRELAGAVGITGTPYASGESAREQGIYKAGNKRMRAMLVSRRDHGRKFLQGCLSRSHTFRVCGQ